MKGPTSKIYLVVVISLLLSAISHSVSSAAVAPVITPLGRITEQLQAPGRIDVDSAGNLYVSDVRKKAVQKYDKYGKLVRTFSGAPVSCLGLAVTPDGTRIYVSGGDVVNVLDGVSGETLGKLGQGAGEFYSAGEIDLDASGYVFVADTGTKLIKVYNPDGVFQYQFGGLGTAPGQFRTVWALTVDGAAGEVYVADNQTFEPSYPKIQVFDLAGNLRRTLLEVGGFGPVAMGFFGGFDFDDMGRGYFLDSLRSQIRILSLPTGYLSTYGTLNGGYAEGQLLGPVDTVYDPLTRRLFVSCDGARIDVFGVDGGQNPVKANAKPGLPVPLSPVNDSEVATAAPQLLYQNAVDSDGNALTYQVRLFQGEALVAEYAGLPQGEGNSSVAVAVDLEENGRYHWSVQAFDGEDVSGWTAPQSFYVNAVQEAPAVPVPVAPLAGEVLAGAGVLSWQASSDPDPFDSASYLVEIAADASFVAPVARQAAAGTSLSLAEMADYPALADGGTYFWRVQAVDSHGLASEPSAAGSFVYDTAVLRVTANMPGARVYLGGNHAYAGRFVGEAPVELRDVAAGPCSVVVERAGFEPDVTQIWPAERENVTVYAELAPAIAPADLKARPLQAGGADIQLGGDAAPFVVDFDSDGLADLLVGDATGTLTLYRGGVTAEGVFFYGAGVSLGISLPPGAAPFVADWNNDGRKDLLVGAADGFVTLHLNTGTEEAPAFGAGGYLAAAGLPISVGASSVPVVIDLDGDGDKDLVVGTASGVVLSFRNDGDDAAPSLVAAGTLVKLSGSVVPFFCDWDADGSAELLLAANEHIYIYQRLADGTYAATAVLSVGADLVGKSGKSMNGAYSLGDRLRIFAYDADGKKGKDLIVGNAAGQVRLVAANGSAPVAAFAGALLDKVAQIDEMVRENAVELAPLVSETAVAIETGNLKLASKKASTLASQVPVGTELARSVSELVALLGQ